MVTYWWNWSLSTGKLQLNSWRNKKSNLEKENEKWRLKPVNDSVMVHISGSAWGAAPVMVHKQELHKLILDQPANLLFPL